jgi:hypothetical protein
MILRRIIPISLFSLLAAYVFAAAPALKETASTAILPSSFAGWNLQGALQTSTDTAAADPTNTAILKEYGFTDLASGTFTRDDGRKLTIRAARFADASGAYGAFTYYKQPEMLNEKIGDEGSSLNNRILFYRGNIVVDALFEKLSVMSAAELRDLANVIPLPQGGARNLPPLRTYLPRQTYVKNTAKYIMGPLTLDKLGSPLPVEMVDFAAGAEVVEGTYRGAGGEGTLMLISYPTPQIATDHMHRIEQAHQPNAQTGQPAVVEMGAFAQKRSGPLVAVATGTFTQSEAENLVNQVHYDADVTWNENTFFDKKNNVANLLLCGALMGITLVAGIAFGGARVAFKRLLRQQNQGPERDFISLNIDESVRESREGMGVSSSPQ